MTSQSHRLGRRRVRLLLDGDPAARTGEPGLAALMDVLAAGGPDRGESQPPAHVLAAFARPAEVATHRAARRPRPARRGGARTRFVGRALTVKTAAVVLVLSGGTMAAAAADALPGPAQRAAHELFGSWGVPAPSVPPREGGPLNPEPGTGPVVVPESSLPGASPSSPSADPDAGTSGPAQPSTSPTPCVTRPHGDGHRCITDQNDGNGDDPGDTNGTDEGALLGTASGSATPTPTPSPRSTRTPPGRIRNRTVTEGETASAVPDATGTPTPTALPTSPIVPVFPIQPVSPPAPSSSLTPTAPTPSLTPPAPTAPDPSTTPDPVATPAN